MSASSSIRECALSCGGGGGVSNNTSHRYLLCFRFYQIGYKQYERDRKLSKALELSEAKKRTTEDRILLRQRQIKHDFLSDRI